MFKIDFKLNMVEVWGGVQKSLLQYIRFCVWLIFFIRMKINVYILFEIFYSRKDKCLCGGSAREEDSRVRNEKTRVEGLR